MSLNSHLLYVTVLLLIINDFNSYFCFPTGNEASCKKKFYFNFLFLNTKNAIFV